MSQSVKCTNDVLDESGGNGDVATKRSVCYFTTRQRAMQLPDYNEGPCSYCKLNVFVTDSRGKSNGQYFHWACFLSEKQECLAAHVRRKLVLLQGPGKSNWACRVTAARKVMPQSCDKSQKTLQKTRACWMVPNFLVRFQVRILEDLVSGINFIKKQAGSSDTRIWTLHQCQTPRRKR